jgi:hypothetical protein
LYADHPEVKAPSCAGRIGYDHGMKLDSVLHAPDRTGPTRDMRALTRNEPVYRQEAFQIQPSRRAVSLNANMQPKPISRSGTGHPASLGLPLKRVPVLIRQSNQRPMEEGTGTTASRWNVSDPSWHALSADGGETVPAPMPGYSKTTILGLGAVVGLVAYLIIKG